MLSKKKLRLSISCVILSLFFPFEKINKNTILLGYPSRFLWLEITDSIQPRFLDVLSLSFNILFFYILFSLLFNILYKISDTLKKLKIKKSKEYKKIWQNRT